MEWLNKFLNRKKDALVNKIIEGKGDISDGINLADECIKKANSLKNNAENLQIISAKKFAGINAMFAKNKNINSNPEIFDISSENADKNPVYKNLAGEFKKINENSSVIVSVANEILSVLEKQKTNLEYENNNLNIIVSELSALGDENRSNQQEYQVIMADIDTVIKNRTTEIDEHNNTIKILNKKIEEGNKAEKELESINSMLSELETELKEIATNIDSEAEEKRINLNKEIIKLRESRGGLDNLKYAGLQAQTDITKQTTEEKQTAIEMAEKNRAEKEEEKIKLKTAEDDRIAEYMKKTEEVKSAKNRIESNINNTLGEIIKLKDKLEILQGKYKINEKDLKTAVKSQRTNKELKTELERQSKSVKSSNLAASQGNIDDSMKAISEQMKNLEETFGAHVSETTETPKDPTEEETAAEIFEEEAVEVLTEDTITEETKEEPSEEHAEELDFSDDESETEISKEEITAEESTEEETAAEIFEEEAVEVLTEDTITEETPEDSEPGI